jgi:hypothetical protein
MFTRLFAGSFLVVGLLLTGAAGADEKTKDCCSAKLACCKEKSACCAADVRLGCCEKGMKCCAEKKACCSAVQKCCTEGLACCKEAKACCGPTKTVAKVAGCCEAKVAEKKASCCTPKVACCADKSASSVTDAKSGCCSEMQKGRNEGANGSAAPKACCGSSRKMK